MKKSFTLLEVLISITIFMIMIIFLYETLDQTKYTNNIFSNKQNDLKESNYLHNIFLEDIAEALSISISIDKEKNSIVKIVTNNSFHNPYFNNITYLVNSSKKLIRMESLEIFNEQAPLNVLFFKNSYIDILLENIEFFEVKNSDINYNFVLKKNSKDRVFYNTYRIKDHNTK